MRRLKADVGRKSNECGPVQQAAQGRLRLKGMCRVGLGGVVKSGDGVEDGGVRQGGPRSVISIGKAR